MPPHGRPGDAAAALDAAKELAERFGATGDIAPLGFVPSPGEVGLHRMYLTLEAGEPAQADNIFQDVGPEGHPFPLGRGHYWMPYSKALARLRGRHDDAVLRFLDLWMCDHP